jgi:hypothetical protein
MPLQSGAKRHQAVNRSLLTQVFACTACPPHAHALRKLQSLTGVAIGEQRTDRQQHLGDLRERTLGVCLQSAARHVHS